jgi:hypothetical protein
MMLRHWVIGSGHFEVSWSHRLQGSRLRSFETPETDYTGTQYHIPEERNPQLHRCENVKLGRKVLLLVTYYYHLFHRIPTHSHNGVDKKSSVKLII